MSNIFSRAAFELDARNRDCPLDAQSVSIKQISRFMAIMDHSSLHLRQLTCSFRSSDRMTFQLLRRNAMEIRQNSLFSSL
jgi:hypothetical protein